MRRHAAPRPVSAGATRAGAAAALGAVTTGAFTALIPTVEAPTPEAADVSTPTVAATLASVSVPLKIDENGHHTGKGAFVPVRSGGSERSGGGQLAQLDKAAGIATRIAEMAAKQQAEQAERAKVDALIAKGGLDGWIAEALRIMDLPQSLAPAVKKIIMKESTGNPNAINRWDANAKRGTPSQGLMQTIPSTFRKFVHPSLANKPITHPVANITAGVRYMIATYGLRTLEQGGRRSAAGHYVGY